MFAGRILLFSGVPFFGYAPFFGPNPQDTFLGLREKYGKIFSIYLGPKLAIVLNDYEAIKAAYVGQDSDPFLGRADGFVFSHLSKGFDDKVHGVMRKTILQTALKLTIF